MARVAIAGQLMGLSLGLGFAAQYDVHAGESAGTMRTLADRRSPASRSSPRRPRGDRARAPPRAGARRRPRACSAPTLLRHGTAAFGHGLALAAPIVLAAFVGNLGLAVMNRAAPAVNVFSIALGGVLILGGVVLARRPARRALIATASTDDRRANAIGRAIAVARERVLGLAADRTHHKATPKRVREFRKRGEIALSRDLVSAATLGGGVIALVATARRCDRRPDAS